MKLKNLSESLKKGLSLSRLIITAAISLTLISSGAAMAKDQPENKSKEKANVATSNNNGVTSDGQNKGNDYKNKGTDDRKAAADKKAKEEAAKRAATEKAKVEAARKAEADKKAREEIARVCAVEKERVAKIVAERADLSDAEKRSLMLELAVAIEETAAPASSAVQMGKFYAVEPSNSARRVVSIDPDTLEVKGVVALAGVTGFASYSLAFSPSGILFGWDATRAQLYRVSLQTGNVVHIGNPVPDKRYINGLAFDNTGKLFGLHAPTNELVSIDIFTGAVTSVGTLGVTVKHNGMAVDFRTGELYAVSGLDADYLMKINKTTGRATIVGPLGVTWGGVATEFNPATGELFAVRNQNVMMKVNLATGKATQVGAVKGVATVNLAAPWPARIKPGRFYSVESSEDVKRLIEIDPETLTVRTVTALSAPSLVKTYSLAFSPDGRIFGWDNARMQLYTIDLRTGRILHVGTPAGVSITGLAFNREGTLFGLSAATNLFYSINTTTGASTAIGHVGFDIKANGLAVNFRTNEIYGVSGSDADFLMKFDTTMGQATLLGSLGMNDGHVGVEFNSVTGELFAVRNTNLMAKVDMTTGHATVLGMLKGVRTVNLAAPWPRVMNVGIDVKSSINRKSKGNVPVVIFGSSSFNTTDIIISSVRMAGASPLSIGGGQTDDNGDGVKDLMLHFNTQDLNVDDNATQLCLTGRTTRGQDFVGCDVIKLVH